MPGARTAGTAAACDGAAPANTTTTAQATKTQRHRIDLLGVHMISLPSFVLVLWSNPALPQYAHHGTRDFTRSRTVRVPRGCSYLRTSQRRSARRVPSADAPSGQRAKPHTVEEHERGAGAIGRRTQRTAGKAAHRRGARTGRRCHRQTHPADSGQSRTPSRSTNGAQVPSADAPSGQRAKPHTVEEHERGAGAIGRRTQRTAGKAEDGHTGLRWQILSSLVLQWSEPPRRHAQPGGPARQPRSSPRRRPQPHDRTHKGH